MDQLPAQVLQLLIRDLLPSQHDRLSLGLCCWKLYDVVVPILYSNPSLRPERRGHRKFVYSFVEGILKKPCLAWAVERLELHRWDNVPDTMTHELFPEVHQIVKSCSLSEDEHSKWIDDIRTGKSDAWLALMFSKLQNLHAIWILFPPSTKYPNHVNRMLQRAARKEPPFDGQPAFPLLTEVYVTTGDALGHDRDLMLPFFSFESVRKFGGNRVGSLYGKLRPSVQRDALTSKSNHQPMSNITTLDLRNISFYGGLHRLVERCKALTSFHLTCSSFFDRENPHPAHPSLGNPSSLLPFLDRHKSTLESVLIDAHDEGSQERYIRSDFERLHDEEPEHEDCAWIRGRKGCFASFTMLKSLHVLLPSLVGYRPPLHHEGEPTEPLLSLTNCLPPSIEELHLVTVYEDLWWLESQLVDMMNGRARTPYLRRLVLEGAPWKRSSEPPEQLRIEFERAGVDLIVTERPQGKFYGPSWERFGLQHDPQRL